MTEPNPLDVAFRGRAHLEAHLAADYPSVLVEGADPEAPDWPVLFVELPTGQVSWHVNPADLDLFGHVRRTIAGMPDAPVWDGHTTDEKHARLDAHTRALAQKEN